MKRRFLLGGAVTVALAGGIGFYSMQAASAEPASGYYSKDFGPEKPITDEMRKSGFQMISTKFGEFYKASEQLDLPEAQTARKMEDLTENTKQIVTDHGVYVKK